MAAPTTPLNVRQQEQARAAIQTTQLVKRLQYHALGENEPTDPTKGARAELDASRIKAIEILLRKTLPDLQAITHSGDPDNPINVSMPEVINLVGRLDKT